MYQTKEKSRRYFFCFIENKKNHTHRKLPYKEMKKIKETSLDYSNINCYKIYNKIYVIINTSIPHYSNMNFSYFQFQSNFDMHFMTVYTKVWS